MSLVCWDTGVDGGEVPMSYFLPTPRFAADHPIFMWLEVGGWKRVSQYCLNTAISSKWEFYPRKDNNNQVSWLLVPYILLLSSRIREFFLALSMCHLLVRTDTDLGQESVQTVLSPDRQNVSSWQETLLWAFCCMFDESFYSQKNWIDTEVQGLLDAGVEDWESFAVLS